MQNNNIL